MKKKDETYKRLNEMNNLSDLDASLGEEGKVSDLEREKILNLYRKTEKKSYKKFKSLKIATIVAVFFLGTFFITRSNDRVVANLENAFKTLFGLENTQDYASLSDEKYEKIGHIEKLGDVLEKKGDVFVDNNIIYYTYYISLPKSDKYLYSLDAFSLFFDKNARIIDLGTSTSEINFLENTKDKRQLYIFSGSARIEDNLQGNKISVEKTQLNLSLIDKSKFLKEIRNLASSDEKERRVYEFIAKEKDTKKIYKFSKEFTLEKALKDLAKETRVINIDKSFDYEKRRFKVENFSVNKFGLQINILEELNNEERDSDFSLILENSKGKQIFLRPESSSGNDRYKMNSLYTYRFDANKKEFEEFSHLQGMKLYIYTTSNNNQYTDGEKEEQVVDLIETIDRYGTIYDKLKNLEEEKSYKDKLIKKINIGDFKKEF